MNFKNKKAIASVMLTMYSFLQADVKEKEIIAHQEPLRGSETQQLMVANFFNIVIQGLLLVTSEDKKDQVQAAAQAINSISNITQLAVRSMPMDDRELCIYVAEHREEILARIAIILDSLPEAARHNELGQID